MDFVIDAEPTSALVRDLFEGMAYKLEDIVGKRPIRGCELIDVRELIQEIRYIP